MLNVRDIIQILGVGLFALGSMVMPRGVPRKLPFLNETGFTRMAEAGAFENGSKMLMVSGPVVFLISFLPLPSRKARKASSQKSNK